MTVQEAMKIITDLTDGDFEGVYMTDEHGHRVVDLMEEFEYGNVHFITDGSDGEGIELKNIMCFLENSYPKQKAVNKCSAEISRFAYECVAVPTIVFYLQEDWRQQDDLQG
ncbi:MAG: hypothetical protein J6J79_11410 [Lachnospiraceae bacterium]|nr:hypothetical protein [Lachnospiraceae bacterium]